MNRQYRYFAYAFLFLTALLTAVPIGVIVSALGQFDAEIWAFILEEQLALLLKNTAFLAVAVGFGVVVLGTSTAWLVAMHKFPLQKHLSWAMMLPLAVPAYVLAFVQLGIFEYTGAVSTFLREQLGFSQGLPDIRNGSGLAVVMSLTFYPYVYLLAKNAFATMGSRSLEVGATLGLTPTQSFFKIALPMARPWIAGGLMLALMEVLADFGTVSVFGFETFTTAIYQAWFGFFSLETAKQLASLLIFFVFALVALEQLNRGKRKFDGAGRSSTHKPIVLKGLKGWLATGYCLLILSLAFIIPIVQLIVWAMATANPESLSELWTQSWHSFATAMAVAVVVVMLSLFVGLSARLLNNRFGDFASRLATMGYAIPGTVLSVGVFVPVAGIDNWLIEKFSLDGEILRASLGVMIVALAIRFLALGVSSVGAGLNRIKKSQIESAQTLGSVGIQNLFAIYLPLLKGALGTVLLMVFVDVMKEMPISLMMKPFDWDMLSARIFSFTSEGLYDKASLPALVIIVIGLVPVMLFSKLNEPKD